jgi:hypothetical protein
MSAQTEIVPTLVEHIKRSLVGLRMPRALEIVDATVRRIERGEVTALEAIDALLAEELTLRENRRVRTALVMARLSTIKTLAGFDFAFQGTIRNFVWVGHDRDEGAQPCPDAKNRVFLMPFWTSSWLGRIPRRPLTRTAFWMT